MKTIKYLVLGALMMGSSAPMMAQDNKTVIAEISKVIKTHPADLKDQVKDVYKKNKKNGEVLVGIGRAFYDVKDTVNANVYADYGIKLKYAPAFVLKGDLKALAGDGGGAVELYDQAIYFDPKDPVPYYKYASVYRKISPSQAVAKLEDLRAQRPDVAVDAMIGRIYYQSNDFDQAIAAFKKADLAKMEERDVRSFAMSYFLKQKYAESLEVAKAGLAISPRDAGYNRLAFFNCTDLGNYDEALKYADALFNKSDSASFTYYDYTYYGNALSGAKRHDEAIAMYQKALQQEIDNKDKRAGVIKQLAEAYKEKDDYVNAIKTYDEYLGAVSQPTATDYAGLAQLYIQYADTLSGAARTDNFKKAEEVYVKLQEKFPTAEEYATFMRARVNAYIDPETKDGLAKPLYEKVVSMIEPKAEKDKSDRARLIECYRYLGYYYLLNNDKEASKGFWAKIVELDPANQMAKQALEQLSK